ncbi:putative protein P5 [Beet chlorosis virus]|uniref:RT protein n=2 Tax=Beet chlorosis virus TaxID=131082 RepID=Q91AV7_9VIRU|nr:putative protein P5 [Beet chlorosis virus]
MAQSTDDAISLYDMPSQRFRYIEDENMNWTNLDSRWYSQNSLKAIPMVIVPVPQGEWTVEISMEGYQPTSSTTDPNKDKQDGLIAYNDDLKEGWNVGVYNNVEITNNKADNTLKYGHPDMELNSCHFNQQQCLERDGDLTCHIKTTGDNASFFIVGPAVQKQSKYNYAVSYGAWTDRMVEIGMIAIALDEQGSSGSARTERPKRVGHSMAVSTWETINLPEKEDSEKLKTGQRQDLKTPFTISGSSDVKGIEKRDLPLPADEDIPDFIGNDPWSNVSIRKLQEEEAMTSKSGLRPQLKPPGLPKPQPVRTIGNFNPTPELVESWRPDVNPGYSKEDVAAATILYGGSIKDGRSMIDKRDKAVLDGRKHWGSSLASSLTGGTLKASAKSEKLAKLTSRERAEFERIKRQQGTTQASEYLEFILKSMNPD